MEIFVKLKSFGPQHVNHCYKFDNGREKEKKKKKTIIVDTWGIEPVTSRL